MLWSSRNPISCWRWSWRGYSSSHLSNQNLVFFPLLPSRRIPWVRIGEAFTIPCQMFEAPNLAWREVGLDCVHIYFPIRTLAHNSGLSCNTFHPNLAMNARFIWWRDLMPNPPLLISFKILSQLMGLIGRWFVLPPHRNRHIKLSDLSHIPIGTRFVCITYKGIELSTDLTETCLLTRLKNFDFQPFNLDDIRSRMLANKCFVTLPEW